VFNTYLKLLPASLLLSERSAIEAFPKGTSTETLFLGLKESPVKLGIQGENHWLFASYDHNAMAHRPPMDSAATVDAVFVSFPSLKDPSAKGHTADISAIFSNDAVARWRDQPWHHRGADYDHFKAQRAQALLAFVERFYPGFSALVAYSELSTPLTIEHFDASDRGTIYGIPCVPERLTVSWARAETPINNLYLTGADVISPGIVGALMGGVITAGRLIGPFGFFRLMAATKKAAQAHAAAVAPPDRSRSNRRSKGPP
jgi:phytoene dehydrogenase-like protein